MTDKQRELELLEAVKELQAAMARFQPVIDSLTEYKTSDIGDSLEWQFRNLESQLDSLVQHLEALRSIR